jgi:hypothetical protein
LVITATAQNRLSQLSTLLGRGHLAGLEKIDRAAAKEFVRLYLGEIVDEAD